MTRLMNRTTAISEVFVPPQLGPYQAHAWHVHLEKLTAGPEPWRRLLSVEERERAARFRFPRDQRRFTVTRALLRLLLGGYLEADPEALSFRMLEHGKPVLSGRHEGTPLHFNVSHSDGMAIFGLTLDRSIGVDVERIRHDFEVVTIAKRFFSAAEQRDFLSLPAAQQHRAFFDCWTRKEAYVKALGDGLSHPLHQFDVSLVPGERARLIATRPDPREVSQWTMSAPDVGTGYAAAIVAKAENLEINCWELPHLV
jgi:4'-phosphopantetheinyl transferase